MQCTTDAEQTSAPSNALVNKSQLAGGIEKAWRAAYVLQTFILGFPSLKTILRYNRLQEAMLKTGVMGREARKQPLL